MNLTRRGLFRLLAGVAAHAAVPGWGDKLDLLSVVPELGSWASYKVVFTFSVPPDPTGRIRVMASQAVIGQWADYYPPPRVTLLQGKDAVVAADLDC